MNCYGSDTLYDTTPSQPAPAPSQPAPAPSADSGDASGDSPQDAVSAVVNVIEDPLVLVEEATAPQTTKLPLGIAVLGACVVAVLWANSLGKK